MSARPFGPKSSFCCSALSTVPTCVRNLHSADDYVSVHLTGRIHKPRSSDTLQENTQHIPRVNPVMRERQKCRLLKCTVISVADADALSIVTCAYQLIRKNRPMAKNSRKATCGTSVGAPLMLRAKRAPSDRMQPINAKFKSSTVGFCAQKHTSLQAFWFAVFDDKLHERMWTYDHKRFPSVLSNDSYNI